MPLSEDEHLPGEASCSSIEPTGSFLCSDTTYSTVVMALAAIMGMRECTPARHGTAEYIISGLPVNFPSSSLPLHPSFLSDRDTTIPISFWLPHCNLPFSWPHTTNHHQL